MESTLRHHLETCSAVFAAETGRKPATVGRLAAGDWRFFERLSDGTSFTARKYDSVMAWFSANWPEGVDWPDAVPRPFPSADAREAA